MVNPRSRRIVSFLTHGEEWARGASGRSLDTAAAFLVLMPPASLQGLWTEHSTDPHLSGATDLLRQLLVDELGRHREDLLRAALARVATAEHNGVWATWLCAIAPSDRVEIRELAQPNASVWRWLRSGTNYSAESHGDASRFDATDTRDQGSDPRAEDAQVGSLEAETAAVSAVMEATWQRVLELRSLGAGPRDFARLAEQISAIPKSQNAPDGAAIAEAVGPFYSSRDVAEWLGVTRQALSYRVAHGQLLAIDFGGRQRVYPVWQFDEAGNVIPGVVRVLTALAPLEPFNRAAWLVGRLPDTERRVIDILREGTDHEIEDVVEAAESVGRAWGT